MLEKLALSLVVACASGSLAFAQPVPNDQSWTEDWASYNYDVAGTRHNRGERRLGRSNASQIVEAWRFPGDAYPHTVGVIHATPAVVDGRVYFGTVTYPAFYCLHANGELAWRRSLSDEPWQLRDTHEGTRLVPSVGVYSSALVADGRVYFGDANGKFYALDQATGELAWSIDSRSDKFPGSHVANVFLGSAIMVQGMVIVGGGAYEHAAVLDPGYACCNGRGLVMALSSQSGEIIWKYNVGPEPETFESPITIEVSGVQRQYAYGPSTSSVWCTPSYDVTTNAIYFGTDVHNSPRRPTKEDPRNYTRHSAAIISLNANDGSERWVTQLATGDVWNHTLPTYDANAGQYKDQSIGDTPKPYSIMHDGVATRVVGVGCKNGGFYVLRTDDGSILHETPRYTGRPDGKDTINPRTLALPSAIGGLQTGCATDGNTIFANGIDALSYFPTGGRVTAISLDTTREFWRHERPRVQEVIRPDSGASFRNVGDPVASGLAIANGVAWFTTLVSNKLVAVDTSNGQVLTEISLGPVFAGPAISRGHVYVGSGNTLFSPSPNEAFFPKRYSGTLYCFGLPAAGEPNAASGK